jgi:hypothetical protein
MLNLWGHMPMIGKYLHALEGPDDKPIANLRHPFFGVTPLGAGQVYGCGLGEADRGDLHAPRPSRILQSSMRLKG